TPPYACGCSPGTHQGWQAGEGQGLRSGSAIEAQARHRSEKHSHYCVCSRTRSRQSSRNRAEKTRPIKNRRAQRHQDVFPICPCLKRRGDGGDATHRLTQFWAPARNAGSESFQRRADNKLIENEKLGGREGIRTPDPLLAKQ